MGCNMSEELEQQNLRRLATIEVIQSISRIENADAIVLSRIRGWNVVTRLDEFQVGEKCLYVEVDSFLPALDSRFEFLAKRGVRIDANDVEGYVLKTAMLRGVYSQGLALSLTLFPEFIERLVGSNVTEELSITVWEPRIPEELSGSVVGHRPSWIPATDEDRIQNVSDILAHGELNWVATEKIDGTSTTIYVDGAQNDLEGVCTRNYDLLEAEGVTLWRLAREMGIHTLIKETYPGERVSVQGETFGEGIQSNPLKIKGRKFLAFTLRVNGQELPRSLWPKWLLDIAVPTHNLSFPETLEGALTDVDSLKSMVTPDAYAEGIVWRSVDTSIINRENQSRMRASFKVISNRYLLKHDR